MHWKDRCWSSNTLATWCEELTHLKRPWCWERLKVEEGDDRGWHGWMASLTQWTGVWASSGSWWWKGKPGVLQSMESDSGTMSNWTELRSFMIRYLFAQKDRNGMDLTEAEDIKKRWQEYTEELYNKDLHNPDNHDGVITDLEPDIWNVKSSGP